MLSLKQKPTRVIQRNIIPIISPSCRADALELNAFIKKAQTDSSAAENPPIDSLILIVAIKEFVVIKG